MAFALQSLLRDDTGATMVEYGLQAALIALVAMVAVDELGDDIPHLFWHVAINI